MKKIAKLLLASLLFFGTALKTKADEGMWLPFLLGGETYKNMQECGIRLTPEQIYSVNQSSIKDAIAKVGQTALKSLAKETSRQLTDSIMGLFNQETEEELLDIPTFLRRQAN